MENARKNRKKGWKNAPFFEGVWKSPVKTRLWRVLGLRHAGFEGRIPL
jgi:hypothetical protein